MTSNVVPPSGPNLKTLLQQIIKVARDIEPLVKGEEHDEGWKFVSIDEYYATAAKALLKAGVSWVIREERVALVDPHLDGLGWTYVFDVFNEEIYIRDFTKFTVPHDLEGPQTAGKVVSYAEKIFMRQLLKLVTGEADADTSATKKGVRRKRIQPVGETVAPTSAAPAEDLTITYEELEELIGKTRTQSELDLLIDKMKRKILWAQNNDPAIYRRLADARTKRMEEFDGL